MRRKLHLRSLKLNIMKKVIYFALASFACTLVAFAGKPVDPVVNIVDEARVIYNVEGWYEASTGSSTFSIGSNLHIPAGTTAISVYITSPVLTSYTFTSTIKDLIIGSSNNHVTLNCAGTGFSSIIGTSIDVSGYCPATGQNETFHIAFLPSF